MVEVRRKRKILGCQENIYRGAWQSSGNTFQGHLDVLSLQVRASQLGTDSIPYQVDAMGRAELPSTFLFELSTPAPYNFSGLGADKKAKIH